VNPARGRGAVPTSGNGAATRWVARGYQKRIERGTAFAIAS
jgi:hypothetical protein